MDPALRSPLLLGLLAPLALASACSDYDLHRPDDPVDEGDPEDTGTPPDPDNPDIRVDPMTVAFGGMPKGCEAAPVDVTITNVGGADLVVSEVRLAGQGFSSFSLSGEDVPEALAPGASHVFQVGFSPEAWVAYEAEIEVESNDPDTKVLDVATTGEGAEDSMHEQSFAQEFYESVDVLWVVDNSGSMGDDLQTVSQHFGDFIQVFLDLDLDYNIALVTTDMDNPAQSGKFLGPVINDSTADPAAEFLRQIDQGSSGSATEKGLEAIEAALTDPLISADNAGFLRPDASLGAIVISDEDNSSFTSAANWATWFEGLKADPDQTTFSALCEDFFFSCTTYSEVADHTGGIIGDLQSSDYAEVMEQISMTSAGLTISFDLDYEPSDLSRVSVVVSGGDVDYSATDGWTYDAADQAIIFHGTAIPSAGQTGVITYPVAGECL